MRQFIRILLLLLFSATTYGQEVLIDLHSMPLKKGTIKKSKANTNSKASLSLPFYDDFSNGQSNTDSRNWLSSSVLVNRTYAINPPTIGIATFDAIGSNGKIYSHLTSIPQKADSLTSQPINLAPFTVDADLYLSFQYQPRGFGDEPEKNDSLVVYFFAKNENIWVKAWAASANFENNKVTEVNHLERETKIQSSSSIRSSFFCAMIPIRDSRFLKDTFQFKIVNYASHSPNLQYPSIRGNCDHWNIDLVYLNFNRDVNNLVVEDVAFSKPIKSLLKNYESIPWRHMNSSAKQTELTNPSEFKIQIRNFYPYIVNVTKNYFIKDLSNRVPVPNIVEDALNYSPSETFDITRLYEYNFESNWTDSAKFFFKSYLTTEVGESYLRSNDTTFFTQKFYNYYAYDDGSSEYGYGLWGEGSQNSMIAVKFHSYEIDSLKGVLFYFNEIPDFTRTKFELVVWSDNNGKPGTQLYKNLVYKPLSTYNADTLYKIDAKLKIGGDFWVGTINTTEDFLNIGFDQNNDHHDKIFFNLTGQWQQSSYNGSLMIKPVFGKFTSWQTGVDKPITETKFSIYPNPAKSSILLNIPEGAKPQWVRIVNLSGQIIMSKPYDSNTIDVSALQTGIYLFQLTQNNKTTSTQKLVIIK